MSDPLTPFQRNSNLRNFFQVLYLLYYPLRCVDFYKGGWWVSHENLFFKGDQLTTFKKNQRNGEDNTSKELEK